jgi:molybdenum cofactor biosynthesis enzyme
MSLAKAETVELKGQRLIDMTPDRLDKLRTWAEEKGNAFILAAIDAIQAAREAADDDDGEVEPMDGSLPF